MDQLLAQSAIAELLSQYNSLVDYARSLDRRSVTPHIAVEQSQVEASASAYLQSARVVARHFGIKLVLHVEK